MFKKLVTLFCLVSSLSCQAETLTVGTNAEFPPFTYRCNDEIVGFDIDIAKEVAQRLGKSVTFKDVPFDALIPDIMLGQVDFVAAGMSYTPERAKRVLFTKSYLSGDPLVVLTLVKSGNEPDLDSLKGKTIVVNEGYTSDNYISDKVGYNIIRLSSPADGFLALKHGRADAFITAESTIQSFMETQSTSQFSSKPIPGTSETCALVISKLNSALLSQIQSCLDEMEKDGTLQKIKTKWKLQ